MFILFVILVISVQETSSQVFQLSASPSPSGTGCQDKLPNCFAFGKESCKPPYDQWAKDYCAMECGYCGGQVTAPPCVDKMSTCSDYPKSVCTDKLYLAWARENCRRYCHTELCTAEQNTQIKTTTIAPALCVDKLDNCDQFGQESCNGSYVKWARENCRRYCKFCSNGLPTPAPPCRDKIPNCNQYDKSTCTDTTYQAWAKDNCYQTCGYCSGGSATQAPSLPGRK